MARGGSFGRVVIDYSMFQEDWTRMLGGSLVEMARKVKEGNVVGGTEVGLRGAWMIALIVSW